eukprot:Nk52_evm82s2367 gene=Nk52_evmTU82s2367
MTQHILVFQHFQFGGDYATSCPSNPAEGANIRNGGRFDPFKVMSLDELSAEIQSTMDLNVVSTLPSYNPYAGLGAANPGAVAYSQSVTDMWTVNGQYQPTLSVDKGEMAILRAVNAVGSWMLEIQIQPIGRCLMHLAGRDGVYTDNISQQDTLILVQAGRADIIVQCDTSGTYEIKTIARNSAGINSYRNEVTLMFLEVSNVDRSSDFSLPTAAPTKPDYLEDLSTATPTRFHTVDFGQAGRPVDQCIFWINSVAYGGPTSIQQYSYVNEIQEWSLVAGGGADAHPYHQHVNHFQIISCDTPDRTNGGLYTIGEWRDTFPALGGTCKIRFKNDRFSGNVMLHCHFLNHEDRGMMHVVYVCGECDSTPGCTQSPTCPTATTASTTQPPTISTSSTPSLSGNPGIGISASDNNNSGANANADIDGADSSVVDTSSDASSLTTHFFYMHVSLLLLYSILFLL